MTLQAIINNPHLIESRFVLKDGEKIIFRPLLKDDSTSFGIFLDSLSKETRRRYGPHPLTFGEAKNICENLDYKEMLRLVLLNSKEEIIGYNILSFQLRDSQVERFKGYGIHLVPGRDVCIAPVIADRYQNKGVGTMMLLKTIELAKSLGLRQITLWQETQVSNKRAIHFYEKLGFEKIAEFERYGTFHCDIHLRLNI
ncbi:MAG: GNAT family N-acetyltransferase [Patescibacteria group bacterium]